MKFCMHCGTQLDDNAIFCRTCGTRQPSSQGAPAEVQQPAVTQDSILSSITRSVNELTTGKNESVHPPMREMFSQVFKSHSQDDAETIFACGTPDTTPPLTANTTTWPTPWLWSRVLAGLGAAFLMSMICLETFLNPNTLPGIIVLGSFMVPVAVLVFFFELNTPKNISFYMVLKIFLVGGCASLLFTLFLFEIAPDTESAYVWAIIIGIVEEMGKAGIVYAFIQREKDAKYHINGMLIGAAVGAGFAAFESAGYALNYLLEYGYETMMDVIFLRAVLAPGGHVVWAAMSGYAIMIAKNDGPLEASILLQKSFLKIFAVPVIMHAIWDMPLIVSVDFPIVQVLLCILSWIFIFVMINNGLSLLADQVKQEESRTQTDFPLPETTLAQSSSAEIM